MQNLPESFSCTLESRHREAEGWPERVNSSTITPPPRSDADTLSMTCPTHTSCTFTPASAAFCRPPVCPNTSTSSGGTARPWKRCRRHPLRHSCRLCGLVGLRFERARRGRAQQAELRSVLVIYRTALVVYRTALRCITCLARPCADALSVRRRAWSTLDKGLPLSGLRFQETRRRYHCG